MAATPGMAPLTHEEVQRVLAAFIGAQAERNRCLFAVQLQTGYRITEILSLGVADVLTEDGAIGRSVTVRRRNMKGKWETRAVVLNAACREALNAYLEDRRDQISLRRSSPLFTTSSHRRLGRKGAWDAFIRAYRRAGIEPRGHGTHGVRKTFAARVYAHFEQQAPVRGGSLAAAIMGVQKALGHKNINSTIRYLQFLDEDVDEAILAIGTETQTEGRH